MKKVILFIAIILVAFHNTRAQAPVIEWQKSYGGSKADWGLAAEPTSDKGFIIAGYANSNNGDVAGNHGGEDAWIVKVDTAGNIQWARAYGGSSDDVASAIVQTNDGGYIFAGSTSSTDGDVAGNHGGQDVWVVKITSAGDIEWQKCLGGSKYDDAFAIEQTVDSGYIVAGATYSNDGDVSGIHSLDTADCWVVKLSNMGTLQWQKCLGGSKEEVANAIQQTSDKGYIIGALTTSNDGDVSGNFTGSVGFYDLWAVKLDSIGTIMWAKCYGGNQSDVAQAVQQTTDGGYVFSGWTSSGNSGTVNGKHGGNDGSYDCWVLKTDAVGNVQWQKCLGGSGEDYGYAIEQTSDGGYIVAGSTQSNNGDVAGNNGGTDYWVVKLDSTSNIQWQKCLGGSSIEQAFAVKQIAAGGYLVAGYSASDDGEITNDHGFADFWVIKLASDLGTDISPLPNGNVVNIYPVPANDYLIVSGYSSSAEELEVKDLLGRIVLNKSIHSLSNETTIDINNLTSGIYFITIKNNTGNSEVRKFVKE